jgi:hypothetical protein
LRSRPPDEQEHHENPADSISADSRSSFSTSGSVTPSSPLSSHPRQRQPPHMANPLNSRFGPEKSNPRR